MIKNKYVMSTIKMGNDEFILYIRKNYPECKITNDMLGKDIWIWIKENDPTAEQIKQDVPTMWWGDGVNVSNGLNIGPDKLPKTATQFEFKRTLLVPLYDYLDTLGAKNK
jgi:hypothetical protein